MTKVQFIDLVRELLSGGDAPAEIRGKYHPRIVEKYIEMAFDDVMSGIAERGVKTGDFSLLDEFALPYNLAVAYDTEREQYYINLPVTILSLPSNSAMRSMSAPKNPAQQFAPVAIGSASVWTELEADKISSVAGYTIENNVVWFDEKFPYGLQRVLMKLVPSFGALSLTDQISIPAGQNEAVFAKVFSLMMQKKENPRDDYNDGNTKQV